MRRLLIFLFSGLLAGVTLFALASPASAQAATNFTPAFTATFPVQANTGTVVYGVDPSAAGCTATFDFEATRAANGAVTYSDLPASLINTPVSSTTPCVYTFDPSPAAATVLGGAALSTPGPYIFSAASPSLSLVYLWPAAPGNSQVGAPTDIKGDAPAEVWGAVSDVMVENLPQVIVLAAAIFIPMMSLRFLPLLIGKVKSIFYRIVGASGGNAAGSGKARRTRTHKYEGPDGHFYRTP